MSKLFSSFALACYCLSRIRRQTMGRSASSGACPRRVDRRDKPGGSSRRDGRFRSCLKIARTVKWTGPRIGGRPTATQCLILQASQLLTPQDARGRGSALMKIRTLARWMGASSARAVLGKLLPWSGILCLNYHRIGYGLDSPLDRDLWSASAVDFDDQVAYLQAHFDVIGADELPDAIAQVRSLCPHYLRRRLRRQLRDCVPHPAAPRRGRPFLSPPVFWITPDCRGGTRLPGWSAPARGARRTSVRGYPGGCHSMSPIVERTVQTLLRTYKLLPSADAAVFLDAIRAATGSNPCAAECVRQTWMTWNQVRALRAAGMSIGGHTVSHPLLARMPPEQQQQEITECGRRCCKSWASRCARLAIRWASRRLSMPRHAPACGTRGYGMRSATTAAFAVSTTGTTTTFAASRWSRMSRMTCFGRWPACRTYSAGPASDRQHRSASRRACPGGPHGGDKPRRSPHDQ